MPDRPPPPPSCPCRMCIPPPPMSRRLGVLGRAWAWAVLGAALIWYALLLLLRRLK